MPLHKFSITLILMRKSFHHDENIFDLYFPDNG